MAFWIGENGNLRKWQVMDKTLTQDLYIFYENDLDIKTAEDVLMSAVFKGGFTIEYGAGTSEPSYENTIKAKLKGPVKTKFQGSKSKEQQPERDGERIDRADGRNNTTGTSTPRDPVLLAWLKKLGMDGLRMKLIYGMCPFRMVYDQDIDSDTIVIPEISSGSFIFRLNKFDVVEVGWMSADKRGNTRAEIGPDKHTGVYVWPDTVPTMAGKQPFKSLAARLRKPYLVLERVLGNFLVADQMASKPPIVTQSKETPRGIDHMSYDEILGETVLFGEDDQTTDNMDRRRIDMSAVSRQSALNNTIHGGGFGFPVYGPRRTAIDSRGLEYETDNVSPWFNNQFPITSGRTTANITLPKPRPDIDKWYEKWTEKVHRGFKVPIDHASSGKKTSAEALSSNDRFQTAVSSSRDDIKQFVEEAWAQSMTIAENQVISRAIVDIEKRRSELIRGRKEGTDSAVEGNVLGLVEQAAIKGDKRLSGAENGPETKELLEDAEERYRQRRLLRQDPTIQSAKDLKASQLESESSVLSEKEIRRILEIASLRGIEVDPLTVQSEVSAKILSEEGSDEELAALSKREAELRQTLGERNRLVWHWDNPLIETGDVIALKREGIINADTARVLIYTNYGLPYDTPAGEQHEERMMDKKVDADMEMQAERQKADLAKIREQNKARVAAAAKISAANNKPPLKTGSSVDAFKENTQRDPEGFIKPKGKRLRGSKSKTSAVNKPLASKKSKIK